jgi:hypothetical protein
VKTTEPGFIESLLWHLQPFEQQTALADAVNVRIYPREENRGQDQTWYSYIRGNKVLMGHTTLSAVLLQAVWDIQSYAPVHVRDFLVLHAGAVRTPHGAALFPATNDTGKSTTVAALIRRGFEYLSDEAAPIDPVSNHVYPFPKLLTLHGDAVSSIPGLEHKLQDRRGVTQNVEIYERFIRPQDLGGSLGGPGPVRWLFFLSGERDGAPRITPLSRAEAVEQLASNAFNLYRYRDRGVILLGRLATDTEAFRLDGGSPDERAEFLSEHLNG